ncbi:hypothetical protein CDCA_CDCA12G3446 [Cyanidium caldarium]|uniref:Uncharacterized protein n=1 Tax=Cyanidium caldarium TaxID=2771 RepID=A0AAV9IZ78_CYACA|nr:hypothetical protein CDCA_CDCA12G3446 [Cyanidium caldarium]
MSGVAWNCWALPMFVAGTRMRSRRAGVVHRATASAPALCTRARCPQLGHFTVSSVTTVFTQRSHPHLWHRPRITSSALHSLTMRVQPGVIAVIPSPYPGGRDTVVLVTGTDVTGRTADVVRLDRVTESGPGAEVYQRSETAERTFERVDALVPIPSAQRNASDDGWVVHREDVEAAKANRASPTGQQRVREEMEELERNIDRRIFERQPVPDPRRGQVLFGAAAALAIALGCAVVHANLAAGSSGGSGGGGGVDAALVAAGMFGVVGAGLLVAGATMNSDSGTA